MCFIPFINVPYISTVMHIVNHSMKVIVSVILLLFSSISIIGQQTTPENALHNYIHNSDTSFEWTINDSLSQDGLTIYRIIFTSQTWQKMPWKHELMVMVPDKPSNSKAFLFIQGGENDDKGEPKLSPFNNGTVKAFSQIASQNRAVTAILSQIPRQPLFGGKVEDALTVETLKYFEQTGDFSWPAWFPMTKGAIRAMDVIEQMTKTIGKPVDGFVVGGGSKRGWTTWLTAAMERNRVKGAVPMVIDILNMPVNVEYQKEMFGTYSEAIGDYTEAGFAEKFLSKEGQILIKMIDPYSYRSLVDMPKLIVNATNDQFWTVDAIKNYLGEIPGLNRITYVPNVNHGLGDKIEALSATSAFFHFIASAEEMPNPIYTIVADKSKMSIHAKVQTEDLIDIHIWYADSQSKDFRQSTFHKKSLTIPLKNEMQIDVDYPSTGFRAFYVAFEYKHPTSGKTYNLCSRMYVASTEQLFDKPYRPNRGESH